MNKLEHQIQNARDEYDRLTAAGDQRQLEAWDDLLKLLDQREEYTVFSMGYCPHCNACQADWPPEPHKPGCLYAKCDCNLCKYKEKENENS
jgi:hypothetical protein